MEIRFNLTGSDRKALVSAVSEITGLNAVYQMAPSFAYVAGDYTIGKDGTLISSEEAGADEVQGLLTKLAERGFVLLASPNPADEDTTDKLAIEVPLDGFTDTALLNLERLVESKANLIRKAIGADELPIAKGEDKLIFPWFSQDSAADQLAAYTQFIHALCNMAKSQLRVTAKERFVDSEKYAFRCFLLRLGFIGGEFALARKVLLANLSGDSSFKNGRREKSLSDSAQNGVQRALVIEEPVSCKHGDSL